MQPTTITSLLTLALAAFASVTNSSPVPAAVPKHAVDHHRPYPKPPPRANKGQTKHNHANAETTPETMIGPGYSIKDLPGLSESKRKPPLKSGNIVITADPSIVVRSNDPNTSYPPTAEFRQEQGLDTLRGFVSHKFNEKTGTEDVETTIVVLDVPRIAEGKYCSFHFFFGGGDSSHVRETFILWSLDSIPAEFDTTWNKRPARHRRIGQFQPGVGPALSLGQESHDAVFKFEDTPIVPKAHIKHLSESIAFPCDPLLGKTAYELVVQPKNFDGKGRPIVESSAWSMNKGLMIEIHGVKAQTPEEEYRGEYDTDDFEEENDDEDY